MIKVGIIGADSLIAGELLRLLINHPETDIISLYAPMVAGRSVSSIHHGFIGESLVNFSEKITPESLDILFITQKSDFADHIFENQENWPALKIIDLTNDNERAFNNKLSAIGLSEINRKPLVRGSMKAYVPSPDLVAPLIALVPLASYMLLNGPLSVSLSIPSAILKEDGVKKANSRYLYEALNLFQPSFSSSLNLSFEENKEESRVISMHLIIDCPLSIEEIERIYEGVYDDHNFTFIVHSPVSVKEVEGTQKCIISLNKPSSATLEITVIIDGRMRGGAGDGVHMLDLLTGLHEKTGLTLKSSAYDAPSKTQSSSWFA